jgi:predicted dehydrogenase
MSPPIRVGVVGANAGWASHTHLPALRSLPQYRLLAVSTTRQESANHAARIFGASLAFDNAQALVTHPDIDLVTVAVKVPQHREIVLAALAAGKHVYCEWPLGSSLAESIERAEAARRTGNRTAIGLQGRNSPWLNAVRELVTGGGLGRILSTSVIASAALFGASTGPENVYMLDHRNGATMQMLSFAHMLDSMLYALG